MADRELWCLVCLYVRPRPGISEDEAAEMDMLTVVNGQQVCLRHVDCAKEGKHETLKSGVWFESRGEIEGLSAYQEWRGRQGDEPPAARMDRSASTAAAALRAYADEHHPHAEGVSIATDYGTGIEYDAVCSGCGASWSDDEGGCTERVALLAAAARHAGGVTDDRP